MIRTSFRMNRRAVLGLAAGLAAVGVARHVRAEAQVETAEELKPGQYTWHPDRSPEGPVAIVVSIPDQRVNVYRNGIRIAVSTCSTGRPGHDTPTGVFTVLQKDKNHHSSTYNDAPMPNMDRLTWSGIALHAGQLPGYPASHGCVRLPLEFSAKLFSITPVGTPVIIAGSASDPAEIVHPGLVLSRYAEDEFTSVEAGLRGKSLATADATADEAKQTSILVSGADKTIFILENGEIILQKPVGIRGDSGLGSHVFILNGANAGAQGMSWHAIGIVTASAGDAAPPTPEVLTRITASDDVLQAIRDRLHPGLVLVTTDLPATPDTRTGKDFVVISQEDA